MDAVLQSVSEVLTQVKYKPTICYLFEAPHSPDREVGQRKGKGGSLEHSLFFVQISTR